MESKQEVNQEEEVQRNADLNLARQGKNPWVRIIDHCEMNPRNYVGGKDVTRMRNAMIDRKNDITKAGGMKKAL